MRPCCLVAEDAQWLDRPTSEALAFVARRIESDPVILLAATRDGYPSVLGEAGLPEPTIAALDDASAAVLLDASAPQLALAARTRVLSEAAGLVVLVAALDDGDAIGEVLDAAGAIAGRTLDLDVAVPAVDARIVDVDLQTFRFRHPLMRSAVAQSAGVGTAGVRTRRWRMCWPINPTGGRGTARRCCRVSMRRLRASSRRRDCGRGGGVRWRSRCPPMRRAAELSEAAGRPAPAGRRGLRRRVGASRCRGVGACRGQQAGARRAGSGAGDVGRGDRPDTPAG